MFFMEMISPGFFYNRYISEGNRDSLPANIPETDQVKSNICNTTGEMYPVGCSLIHLAGRSSAWCCGLLVGPLV